MIAAGIVTYNPNINLLKENIEAIYTQVDKVIVFDNGSDNIIQIERLFAKYEIIILKDNRNKGIAYALNQICSYCKENKYSHVLTLDQDTICPEFLIDKLIKYIDKDIAIVAPSFYNRGIENSKKEENENEYVEWVISSASLTSIEAWDNVNGFDEFLFIDGVDIDFCWRLSSAGYKILKINSVIVSHMIGESKECGFGKFKTVVKNHSSFRKYYIARNTIVVAYKNKKNIVKPFFQILKQLIYVIVFENEKYSKVKRILNGMIDAIKYIRNEGKIC